MECRRLTGGIADGMGFEFRPPFAPDTAGKAPFFSGPAAAPWASR